MTTGEQEKRILEQAERRGVSNNYFFRTTFQRYKEQLRILKTLKKGIKDNGATVTKEYVKGRENIVTNPAITEYNKTATAANNTVQTLISIMKSFADDEEKGGKLRQLMDKLNSEDEDAEK